MLTMAGEAIQATAEAVAPLPYWNVFWWFMLGVVFRQAYKLLGWFATPAEHRKVTLGQCLAGKAQGIITGVVAAWIWVGGHLWALLDSFNIGGELLDKMPNVSTDQLSSVGVGFLLEWLVVEKLVDRFGLRKPTGG